MTRGKANHSNRYLKWAVSITLSLVLSSVCLLLIDAEHAVAQSPTLVLGSAHAAADLDPLSVFTESGGQSIEGELALGIEPAELITLTPQDTATQVCSSSRPLDAPLMTCSTGQSIKLRKNVIGCQARYQVLPQDEIWIVSARNCTCDPENTTLLKVKKFENNRWQTSCLDELSIAHLTDTRRATMLYIHGNQTNYEYGVSRGFQFYDNLFVKYKCPRPPVRIVLWLWESERELPRLYSDYLVKSRRAMTVGKSLTKTLDALGNRNVALVGFSLGAQVILSSLEQMESRCDYSAATDQKGKYNIALFAPATDPDYVCDIADRTVQSKIVSRSTIIVNSDDRAVKAMRFVIRHECPEAKDSFAKLARCHRVPLGETEIFEVSQEISRKHSIRRYTNCPTARHEMTAVLNRTAEQTF
jgi:hypothetical protein